MMAEGQRCKHNLQYQIGAVLIFVVISFLALNMPDYPAGFSLKAFMHLPIEVPIIGLMLVLLTRRLALFLAALATLGLAIVLFLKLGDIGVQIAFQRPFNPYLDFQIFADGWNVFSGSIGALTASIVVAVATVIYLAVLTLFFLSMRYMAGLSVTESRCIALFFAGVLVIGVALWTVGSTSETPRYADARASSYMIKRVKTVAKAMDDLRTFEKSLDQAEVLPDSDTLFDAVRGRDIVLIFIESYGRSAIEDPRYAPLIDPRLKSVDNELTAAGFSAASGWSWAPTMGGLSWLAHSTFLSGLWVDNQARYEQLILSDRKSLNRLFRGNGWRTAAVMPAITMDWPEAGYYGYDTIYASDDLGYQGKPFNWVTMPDQYTLSAFDKLVRHSGDKRPVMAEIALISSHAPWTPVPTLLDWDDVGDGSVFNEQATSGDPPSVVWSDRERVRRQYIATIDYSLQTVGAYIARFGEDAVFVVLGDHQPAPLVTGPDASRSVPVHVISRDADLVKRFESEGFTKGMIPAANAPEPTMDLMRDRLINLFSSAKTTSDNAQ